MGIDGTSGLDAEIQDAALRYVKRLYSQSGDSELIRILKKESYKNVYRKMILRPDEFQVRPRPVDIEPWHGIKPENCRDFLKTKVVLPALPQIQVQLQSVLDDSGTTEEDLASVIAKEPKLVASVLRLANKKLSSSGQHVDTPLKAVKVLGIKDAGALAMGTVSISLFKRSKYAVLSVEKFWKHSIACAVIARKVANLMAFPDPDRFFSGGILHDIGLFLIFESHYGLAFELLELAKSLDKTIYHAETALLGFDHATLGGIVLKDWHFPRHLIAAAAGHHNPARVKSDPDAMIMHLSCFIARALGYDLGLSPVLGFFDNESWVKTGLGARDLFRMLPEIETKISEIFKLVE